MSTLPRLPLKLTRPLVFFDIESTGLNVMRDRVIDLALLRLLPDGTHAEHTFRIDPEMPIPPGSTAIHGIRDEDVRGSPNFAAVAADIGRLFADADLGGYNVLQFDVPMLQAEFKRAGGTFDMAGRRVFDVQRVYHRREPRDLSAALMFYCGDTHAGAHGALADVQATLRVAAGQFTRYNDLPTDLDGLDAYCNPNRSRRVDLAGKIVWDDHGEAVLNFGMKQGQSLRDLARSDPKFLEWMTRKDFPADTLAVIRDALAGKFPTQEPAQPKPDGKKKPKPGGGNFPAPTIGDFLAGLEPAPDKPE